MPDISFVIPVYKAEAYLRECVDSILSQSAGTPEVILIDDGSPDKCPLICDDYAARDARVQVIHKENGGPSAARNLGLQRATGDYVWFVDSDDAITPDAMARLLPYCETGADIIRFGLINKVGDKLEQDARCGVPFVGMADHKQICALAAHACSTELYAYAWRNLYRRAFLLREDLHFAEGVHYGEDSLLNSKAYLTADSVLFADEHLYIYRYLTDGLSKKITRQFDPRTLRAMEEYDRQRDENYEAYCRYPDDAFYEDAGRFTLEKLYQYSLLPSIYRSGAKQTFALFRQVTRSPLIRKAFARFDIGKIKSKSLDWFMLWFARRGWYFPAHLICKYVLYKNKQ